jgi:hypothetical protein
MAYMQKGSITVENGVVIAVQAYEDGFGRNVAGGQSLYETLKSVEKQGRVEGALPQFTTEGSYQINLIKDESQSTVTG